MKTALLAAATALFALPAFAQDITIDDAYARSAGASAIAGAAFFMIHNNAAEDDRLIAARSPVAERVELHTHLEEANGVMRMVEVEDGFPVPAGGMHGLARGGDHVMFMGITQPFEQGATIPLTLVFEKAGEIELDVPVDLERQDGMGMKMQNGNGNGQGTMSN